MENKRFDQDRYFHNSRYLDIVVSSSELKKLIKSRTKELGLSMYQLAEAADMTYSTFKEHYLQSDDPRSSPAIRQENIIKIAKLLGINVRMTLVLSPIDNVDTSEIKKIPYRNDRKRRNSKKKDTDRGSVQGGDDSK